MNRCIIAILFATTFFNCSEHPKPINRFADSAYVSIGKFQDERNISALLKYLEVANPGQRAYATMAFASVQDSSVVGALGKLLQNDEDVETRKSAAFAIGQTRCSLSEEILLQAAGKEKDSFVLAEIVEGYGKVARHWNLNIIPSDTVISTGLSWAIYHAGLTGIGDSVLNEKAVQLLSSPSQSTRMGAVYYFARSAKGFNRHGKLIAEIASHDPSENVRMAAALALRKIPANYAVQELIRISSNDPSYRVKINAVRALGTFSVSQSMIGLFQGLHSADVNVAIQASETLLNYDTADFLKSLLPIARTAQNWRVQANLYAAALKGSRSKDVEKEIASLYLSSTNRYQKAALLNALGQMVSSFEFVRDELFSSSDYAIKTAGATAIVAMNQSKYFNNAHRAAFLEVYAKGISTADLGLVSIFGAALADPVLDYKRILKDTAFLYSTRRKLKLPADNEALQSLDRVIAYFEGKATIKPVNSYNHPIDWNVVTTIPSDQKATLTTEKGNIVIRLLVDEAPGSVVNFVALAKSKYFDGKTFHRVVPNFVAQGGCNRGDGYGGEDYSIRSEFTQRRYTTGSIGMASAGKDTEGTQWFITHSPTPHLDGKYTIFAVVESGMDVVLKLEVGDKIIAIAFPK